MIKDQCNNCRKNGTSSCTNSIIYDSRPCDEYVKKLDLSKQDNQGQTYYNPVQQPAPQNSNQQTTVKNNQSTFASVFSFKGRIRRTQYWLTNFIIGLLFVPANISNEISDGVAVYTLLIFIPALWISLATIVKRFHDLGKSGWFTCFLMIPIANFIFGIYAVFFKGEENDNQYGPNPY
jgi:uncharacterized membrane protein YhaH (DUF805 family)